MSEVENIEINNEVVEEPVEQPVEQPVKKKVERQKRKKIIKVVEPKKEPKKELKKDSKFFFPKINEDLAFMTAGIFSAGAMIYLFALTKNSPQQSVESPQQEIILSKPPSISEEQPKKSKPSFNFI